MRVRVYPTGFTTHEPREREGEGEEEGLAAGLPLQLKWIQVEARAGRHRILSG